MPESQLLPGSTTSSPKTTTPAPVTRTREPQGVEIPGAGGDGPDKPSGYHGGGLVPAEPGHKAHGPAGHPSANLAASANPVVAAGGVAGLGALGLMAGFIAYRGAVQAQQRRAATREAFFGAGGGA